ncbi:MAG: Lar family restriction alleviation protein [Clostridia bacterium]|nr:Lar family restriction alleviation protein [Clostridia bacterium]
MAQVKFKPCPFCGDLPTYEHFCEGFFWVERIKCHNCNLKMDAVGTSRSEGSRVARLWNRRDGNAAD